MMRKKGYIEQLIVYIKKNLSKGYTLESLRWALINQGYSRIEVEKAVKIANEQLAKQIPKLKEKPVIRYEVVKDKDTGAEKEKTASENKPKSFLKKLKSWFE